jgi:hypothetical protein
MRFMNKILLLLNLFYQGNRKLYLLGMKFHVFLINKPYIRVFEKKGQNPFKNIRKI